MRFSVLTLNLVSQVGSSRARQLEWWCTYIAENNISCACVQGCTQSSSAATVTDDWPDLREDNTLLEIQRCLERFGLKYGLTWATAGRGADESGVGLVAQLPILGSCSRPTSADDPTETLNEPAVSMAELAVAPNVVIDVYSVLFAPDEAGPGRQLDTLSGFLDETPSILESLKPPPPKRRGPPRKRTAGEAPPHTTRLLCVAGNLGDAPEGIAPFMKKRGFLEASAPTRDTDSSPSADGRGLDCVYIKPALRPLDVRIVAAESDGRPDDDSVAVFASFEV